jgi:anthranilate synthase
MISVERRESTASAQDVDTLLAGLDTRPGLWMGCDVAAEGLYRKESVACAVPAVRFCLEGATLKATALTAAGAGLLAVFGMRDGPMASGKAVVAELRRFLALFDAPSADLGYYGAFSFDYDVLGSDQSLPADGRCRCVLYFPECVLRADASGARWINYTFRGIGAGPVGTVPPARVAEVRDELPPGGHALRVRSGVDRLRRGELQSLVLSQTFRRRTMVAPSRAFAALRERNPYPAMFFCNLAGGEILFGASPDLQLRADASWVESAPVCGTLRRGADPMEDAEQAFALLASDKEGAAIALCADSAASEHAAVCEPGTVEVLSHRRAHFFSTIIHAIDHLRGRRRAGLDGFDLLLAHATPATVTGTPKSEAVRAIVALEGDWRGWYAGAVARIGTDGSVEAYTVLRAARLAGGVAEIRTGGNILVDSDPVKEEEESRLKAQTLFRVLEAESAAAVPEPGEAASGSPGPASWRVRVQSDGDEAGARLVNALAAAGAVASTGARITVLSGVSEHGAVPEGPLVAIGQSALWLLRRDGAVPSELPVPEFARVVAGRGLEGTFLQGMGAFKAGWYVRHALRADGLPVDWRASAVSDEGWVLAAQHRERRICALVFRPDSVLSLHAAAGCRALQAAFAWLDRAMFARIPERRKHD